RGILSKQARDVREKDSVRFEIELNERAYCYLIAFNPGGDKLEQPLYPDEGEIPQATDRLDLPLAEDDSFGLTDGPGLQAFVLVAAPEPLPAYDVWKQNRTPIWGKMRPPNAWGIWQYDGSKLVLHDKRVEVQPPSDEMLAKLATANLAFAPHQGLAGVPWE